MGVNRSGIVTDQAIRLAAFPISDKKIFGKTMVVGSLGTGWLETYHSYQDTIARISSKFMVEGLETVQKLL